MSDYPELRVCTLCFRVMRPSRRRPADYPFKTVPMGSAKHCGQCHQRAKAGKAGPAKPIPAINAPDPQADIKFGNTLRGYARWLADRNNRLAHAGGQR